MMWLKFDLNQWLEWNELMIFFVHVKRPVAANFSVFFFSLSFSIAAIMISLWSMVENINNHGGSHNNRWSFNLEKRTINEKRYHIRFIECIIFNHKKYEWRWLVVVIFAVCWWWKECQVNLDHQTMAIFIIIVVVVLLS